MTDNPNVANGKAGSKYQKSPGGMHAIRLKPPKLFDLDVPLDPRGADRQDFITVFGDHPLFREALTGRELFDAAKDLIQKGIIDANKIDEFNLFMKNTGFDGYKFVSKQDMSIDKDPHNQVMLFDQSKIALSRPLKPDLDAVPQPSKRDVQRSVEERTSQTSDLDFDKQGLDEVTLLKDTEVDTLRTQQLEEDLGLLRDEAQSLKDQGLLTPDLVKKFDELKDLATKGDLEDRAVKAAITCLGR